MKSFIRPCVCMVLACLLAAAPMVQAQAQDATPGGKPVAIVSVASYSKLLGDVGYLTKTAGAEDAGQMVMFMAGAMTQGLDKQKPAGVYVTLDDGEPKALGFIPVTDLDKLFNSFKAQLGEPEDVGDGVYEVAKDQIQSAFVKEQGGWAFVAQSKDQLTDLPADPSKLLGKLPAEYDIAVRMFVQNVPTEMRQMAIDQMKLGFEARLEQGDGQGDPEMRELNERMSRNSVRQLIELINGSDQITFGWTVDEDAKSTHLDFSVTAVEGTKLARQMALIKDAKSGFSGFLQDDAAITMNVSSQAAPEDIEQTVLLIKSLKQRALVEIDEDGGLPDDKTREQVKEIVGSAIDVVEKTMEGGKFDGGAALILKPGNIGFAAGGLVADGKALDVAFQKLVQIAKNEPEFPEVKLNAAKHAGVTFHTLTVPVDDPEASAVVGEELDVVVGTGEKSVYVAFGNDALSLLKSIIDKSAAGNDKTVPPMQVNVALGSIIKFASSIEPNPVVESLAASVDKIKGNDHLVISAKSIPGGVNYRIRIEEGVIQLIGEAVQNLGALAPGGF